MVVSSGVDLLEISRLRRSLENPRFVQRVFSPEEREEYRRRGGPISFLAGCFCAKEAFSKALGTGVRDFALTEVAVKTDELGAPSLCLSGRALALARERGLRFTLSISHTKEYAVAFVVGYSDQTTEE